MEESAAAIAHLLTPWPLSLLLLGTILGIVVGAIPGLTGAMLIALTLPLTFQMDYAGGGQDALVLLVSMYVGSVSGGLISATLLRMPGTPASIMTTLDGYPMARRGEPGRALGLGITASFVGGIVSWVFLIALARPMAVWSTMLGPFEFFALVLVALVLIAGVSGKSLVRGVLAGLLGILARMPGTNPATGELRWTGGFVELNAGLPMLPVLIGLFAVSQIIQDILAIDTPLERPLLPRQRMRMTLAQWRGQAMNLLRSSVIGTWVGILPGIGANVGSVLAYSAARSMSRRPEIFGQGADEGIVASEAANNATVGGALIPLVSLGIPGSVIDAILLGALVIHGLQPGPLLFKTDPDVVYAIMAAVLLANCVMFVFMMLSVRLLVRLVLVPRWLLIPLILVFCVVGSYALNNRMFDVWVMLVFGVVGFGLERAGIPLAPLVIGFVLAPVAEENLCSGLMLSGGSYWPLVTSPLSAALCLVSLLFLAWTLVYRSRRRRVSRE